MKTIIQKLTTYILILIFATRMILPVVVLADTTPTDTPSPTPAVTSTDTPTPTASSTTNNPSPTPSDTPTTSPSPTGSPTPTDTTAPITPTITPTADTVSNTTTDPTTTPTSSPNTQTQDTTNPNSSSPTNNPPCDSTTTNCASQTTTGNGTSTTQDENNVNTASINSTSVNQTINIFLPQDGNIDLSDPSKIAANVVSNNTQNGEVFNISITNNNAYVDANVVSIADTGNNAASGSGAFAINTGNAISLVQLVNKVNVTLVNSQIHFITINIYGTLNGNIILPEPSTTPNCTTCGVTQTTANNQATVTNTVNSNANTGTNTVTATNGSSVTTGNANALVNLINIINEVVFGISFDYLIINNMGTWNGNFVGWGDIPATNNNGSLLLSSGTTPDGSNAPHTTQDNTISQNATVNNTISSSANTGNNSISANGHGIIVTGNADSIVSLINLINSVFINSKGFFAFINIFGTLNGSIGGSNHFPTPTPSTQNASTDNGPAQLEDGGQLSVTNANNTGAYVLPGDTVTFFIAVKNPGKGKTYHTHLHLALLKDGIDEGGADYDLGDIEAGHMIQMSTGLVLSNKTPGGSYVTRASVTGTTGNDNTQVQALADSSFSVYVPMTRATNEKTINAHIPHIPEKHILAAHTPNMTGEDRTYTLIVLALLSLVLSYVIIRTIQGRNQLILAFAHNQNFRNRIRALKLFLM